MDPPRRQSLPLDLLREPVPRLVRGLALPVCIGFFFQTMFNVVDTFVSGLISTEALAALSLSFPVFFLIIAFGSGLSTGATALISHELGAGRRESAELYAAQVLSFGLLLGLVLTAFGLGAGPWMFRRLGAEGSYLETALAYMNVIFGGAVLFLFNHAVNATLHASGDTRSFRNFLVAGCLLNLALDPWLALGGFGLPALGIAGIAFATLAVQVVGVVYLLGRAHRTGLLSRRSAALSRPRWRTYRDIAAQGIPAGLNMMTIAAGIFIIMYFVQGFGKEAVAAFGVATRVEQIALLPIIGLSIATLTLVGQNHGAGQDDRVRETFRTSLRYGFLIMCVGAPMVFFGAPHVVAWFTDEAEVIRIGIGYLRVAALVLWAYVVLYVSVSALQGLKKPLYAVWIGIFRQIAAPAIVFPLLAHAVGWGIWGIWWGICFVTWGAALITLVYTRRVFRRRLSDGGAPETT